MTNLLNIVDDNDEVIGRATREEIHRDGLLHREVHVDFITPDRLVILQHRAKDKETYPDLLDAAVGGHVEIGESYEQAAVKEAEEETGVKINPKDLIFVNKIKKRGHDTVTGRINHVFSSRYVYLYKGRIEDLRVEVGKALGFEAWSLEKLLNLSEAEKSRFIPSALKFITGDLLVATKDIL